MNNFSFALQILPLHSSTKEIIETVDAVIDKIASSKLNYVVGPFETTVEGEIGECLALLQECIYLAGENAETVFANVKINYCKGREILAIDEKISKFM